MTRRRAGHGSIEELKSGRHRARVVLADGVRHECGTFDTHEDAEGMIAAMLERAAELRLEPVGGATLIGWGARRSPGRRGPGGARERPGPGRPGRRRPCPRPGPRPRRARARVRPAGGGPDSMSALRWRQLGVGPCRGCGGHITVTTLRGALPTYCSDACKPKARPSTVPGSGRSSLEPVLGGETSERFARLGPERPNASGHGGQRRESR